MTIFDEAEAIVGGDRQQDYGGVRGSFDRIALTWSAILGCPVTGEQVGLCMISLKLVRESHRHKRDNLVDVCGYARALEQMTSTESSTPDGPPPPPRNPIPEKSKRNYTFSFGDRPEQAE